MIEVELPDGTIAEFPDGTDQGIIKSTLQKRFSTQEPASPWTDGAIDVGKSFASGVGRGVAGLAGLPGTVSDLFNNGMSYVTGLPQLPKSPLSGRAITGAANAVSGDALAYEPSTTVGDYAGTVGEFLPGAAVSGANVGNLLRYGVLPGLASEGAGQLTDGTSMEPYARVAAALVAPAVPALASRAISPFSGSISPERMKAIQSLEAEGVPLTAGQKTGSNALRYAESELGGARAASVMDDQARAFTEAATSRAGIQGGLADPATLSANQSRLGKGFEDIAARNTLASDPKLGNDIGSVLNRYGKLLETQQKPIIDDMASDIISRISAGGGKMSGVEYQTIRSDLSAASQSASNQNLKGALKGLRNALDDAMARSVTPEDAAEWARLRGEYGTQKVLEKAATGAGEGAAMGTISPARLRQAVSAGRQGSYARAEGSLDELARSGQAVMSPLPNSGTAGRLRAQNLGSGMLAGGGALAGGLPGMVAGLLAPQIAGAGLMSRAGQSYLTNQLAPNMSVIDPRTLSVIQSLIGNEETRR